MSDPAERIRAVLQAKGHAAPGYWREHGRRRFAAELASDGFDADEVRAILQAIDAEVQTAELDDALDSLRRREGVNYGRTPKKAGGERR